MALVVPTCLAQPHLGAILNFRYAGKAVVDDDRHHQDDDLSLHFGLRLDFDAPITVTGICKMAS